MKYVKKILSNGMALIFVPIKDTRIIATGFFINAGSRNENEENNGVAHFLEHMMFKGTTTRTAAQLFNELDTLGTVYNAATTTQTTYYYVYGSSDDTKKILDIILDLYINPEFKENEIEKERKVIIEEMRMRSDMPLMKLYSKTHKKIFKGTTLERDIIGTAETVLNMRKNDFVKFRKTMYKPENTVFVITGNINPIPIYKIISKVLQPLENPSNNIPSYKNEKEVILKNMEEQQEPYVYIKKNTFYQQVYVLLAFPLYDLYKTKYHEIDLLSYLLSAGFSSRLNQALREENGITYSSTSYPVSYSDSGIFFVQMILNPKYFVEGIKILMTELKKTKEELMTKDEMKKIINITKNDTLFALSKPLDILIFFGLNFLANKNYKPNFKKEIDNLKKITRVDVQKIATDIFVRNKINLFVYGNVEQTDFNFLDL